MNVQDVMNREPQAVRMVDRLDEAARVLWDHDCGFVPVVDGSSRLVGVLTDRDLCMASYTQGRALADLPVLGVMSRELTTCRPNDTLAAAMDKMQHVQVHRLPVVDARGMLVGVLSSNDLIQAQKARPAAVSSGKVLETLAGITAPRAGARDFREPAAKSAESAGAAAAAGAGNAAAAKKASPRKASKKAAPKKAPARKAAAKKTAKKSTTRKGKA